MALLTVTEVTTRSQLEDLGGAATAAASGGDTYPADDRTVLAVLSSTNQSVLTIARSREELSKEGFGEIAVSDITVTVVTGDTAIIAVALGTHGAGGIVTVTYSDVTGLTVVPLRIGRL